MKYEVQFKPRAVKDIEKISSRMQTKIIKGIEFVSYEDLRCLRDAEMAERNASTIGIGELKKRIQKRTSKSSRPHKPGR